MIASMQVIESLDGETVTAVVPGCIFCGKPARVSGIPADAFATWYSGGIAVQDALPMLSADDREILATGTHGQCLDGAFAEGA